MDEPRKQREKQFHDHCFGAAARKGAGIYAVVGGCWRHYDSLLAARCPGRTTLEYGCGPGSAAFLLAARGSSVTGIDLSETAIRTACGRARRRAATTRFCVMDAERLGFAPKTFHLVCGRAILHHLDLRRGLAEISRTLTDDGMAIFAEPLGHNPFINLYRRLTPTRRTPDEHPLRMPDLAAVANCFRQASFRYFHFLSLAAIPFQRLPGGGALLRWLDRADQRLFDCCPWIRRHAWTVVMELAGPVRRNEN